MLFFVLFILCALLLGPVSFVAAAIPQRYLHHTSAAEARVRLLDAAESFLGTPYRFGGIDRRGLDCSGFVHLSFLEGLNVPVPRTSAALHSWAARIDRAELEAGDLVFFVTVGNRVSHVGIYTGGGSFIHAASDGPHTGVIFSRLTESFWSRTFHGAGRALPWDVNTGQEMAAIRNAGPGLPPAVAVAPVESPQIGGPVVRAPVWTDSGLFVGFGAAWTWGGLTEGAPSIFRGVSAMATTGYKWSTFRLALQLRPNWDNALGVFRLPLTLSAGTDRLQFFGGPAFTFGQPSLNLENQQRQYSGGNSWLWELGASAAFNPITIGPGAASIFGELAWQSFSRGSGESFNFIHDMTANLRISTGIRYLWRLR